MKNETTTPNKIIPFQTILDARIDILAGMSPTAAAKKNGLSVKVMQDRLARIDEITTSNLPALSTDQKIISEALSDKMKPIKEELSLKSLEIVREADKIILDRLKTQPEEVSTKDVLRASESHSGRFARITGFEEDPTAGNNGDEKIRIKNVNVFIDNTFKNHREKLEHERTKVNDTTPTPIYEGEVE